MSAPSTSRNVLTIWATAMLAEGQSGHTVKDRVATVRRAAAHAGQAPEELTTDGIRRWLACFTNAHTRSTYYKALRAWTRFLVEEGHRDDDPLRPIRRPRTPKCLPRPCPSDGRDRLLALKLPARTRLTILLAGFAGLRVHEIAKIRGEDVDLEGGIIRVFGKGGTEAVIPLHPLVVEAAAGMPARGWWFPSPVPRCAGRPVGPNTISNNIRLAMRRVGIDRGSAHSLRHLFATELLDAGANVREVQTLLRHADLTSTMIYTAVTASGLRAAVLRLPGLPDGAR